MNTPTIPCVGEGAANHGSRGVAPTLYRTHVTAVELLARHFGEQLRPVTTRDDSDGNRFIHDGSDTL